MIIARVCMIVTMEMPDGRYSSSVSVGRTALMWLLDCEESGASVNVNVTFMYSAYQYQPGAALTTKRFKSSLS